MNEANVVATLRIVLTDDKERFENSKLNVPVKDPLPKPQGQ